MHRRPFEGRHLVFFFIIIEYFELTAPLNSFDNFVGIWQLRLFLPIDIFHFNEKV